MNKLNSILSTAILFGTPALADGFRCQVANHPLSVTVYNHTQPEMGTRNAAVMILSDSSIGEGRKTIAVLRDGSGLLRNDSALYEADVDLRFSESNRKGERVAATKLGQLKSVELDVDFVFGRIIEDESLDAVVRLNKRDGEVLSYSASCERYKKSE